MLSKPNLFEYATSELSQDAFICWLLEWINYPDDNELHKCAKALVIAMYQRHFPDEKLTDDDIVGPIIIFRQKHKLDVSFEIKMRDKQFVFLIEDKVHSTEHDKQLNRYYNDYKREYKEQKFELIPIYFKTGYILPKEETINDDKFRIFDSEDFITVLNNCNSNNPILLDYKCHLQGILHTISDNKIVLSKNDYDKLKTLVGQIDFFKMLIDSINSHGFSYNYRKCLNYENNLSGHPWCDFYLAQKTIGEGYAEVIMLRIDAGRAKSSLSLRQYSDIKKLKNKELQNQKYRNLQSLKETFEFCRNDNLYFGKAYTDNQGRNSSEIAVLEFDSQSNTTKNMIESYSIVISNFINKICSEPNAYHRTDKKG